MSCGYVLCCFLSKAMVSKWPASCFLAGLRFEQSYISWSSHMPGGEKKIMQGKASRAVKGKGQDEVCFVVVGLIF